MGSYYLKGGIVILFQMCLRSEYPQLVMMGEADRVGELLLPPYSVSEGDDGHHHHSYSNGRAGYGFSSFSRSRNKREMRVRSVSKSRVGYR